VLTDRLGVVVRVRVQRGDAVALVVRRDGNRARSGLERHRALRTRRGVERTSGCGRRGRRTTTRHRLLVGLAREVVVVVAVVLVVLHQAEVEAQLAHGPGHVVLLSSGWWVLRRRLPEGGAPNP